MFFITQKVRKAVMAVFTSFFCISSVSTAVPSVPSPWFDFSLSTWWNRLPAHKKIAFGTAAVATVGVAGYCMYRLYNKSMSLSQWTRRCAVLPSNRRRATLVPVALPWHEFLDVKNAFCALSAQQLSNTSEWFQETSLSQDFLKKLDRPGPVTPFVQRLIVPEDAHIYFHGDLHGDIRSLLAYLGYLQKNNVIDNNFKIIDPKKHYICFLGDYTDRGNYGIEVVYTIMRLKLVNPDNVILVRGNHEDCQITSVHGFSEELKNKYPQCENAHDLITKIYDFLPAAVWIGTKTDVLQCCHGGMEMWHSPDEFLASGKKYALFSSADYAIMATVCDNNHDLSQEVDELHLPSKKKIRGYHNVGYMWSDFYVSSWSPTKYDQNRGYCFGKKLTHALLKYHSKNQVKVHGVFRAHQHQGDMMNSILYQGLQRGGYKGISLLWDQPTVMSTYKQGESLPLAENIVATFNVSPDSTYGQDYKFTYDTFGCLMIGENYTDWRLSIINQEISTK